MKKVLLFMLVVNFAWAEFTGFVSLGAGYKEDPLEKEGQVGVAGIAIIRGHGFALEGNRLSFGITRFSYTSLSLVARSQNGMADTGLQLTQPLILDFFFQLNTMANLSVGGSSVEAMIFKRMTFGNLELIPSLAVEHNSRERFNELYSVNEDSVNIEAELLTIYNLSQDFNLASTIFLNSYDEVILDNSLITKRDFYRASLTLGYKF